MAKIALGTWAWGAGAFGGDKVFGSKTPSSSPCLGGVGNPDLLKKQR